MELPAAVPKIAVYQHSTQEASFLSTATKVAEPSRLLYASIHERRQGISVRSRLSRK